MIIVLAFAIFFGFLPVSLAQESPRKESIPTVAHLDLNKVRIVLAASPEAYKPLHAKMIDTLKSVDMLVQVTNPTATLKIDLQPRPIDDGPCKGAFLYAPSLELVEKVHISHNSLTTWATTWSISSSPYVFELVTMEMLEEDLEQFLHQFVLAYKMGNPKERK